MARGMTRGQIAKLGEGRTRPLLGREEDRNERPGWEGPYEDVPRPEAPVALAPCFKCGDNSAPRRSRKRSYGAVVCYSCAPED